MLSNEASVIWKMDRYLERNREKRTSAPFTEHVLSGYSSPNKKALHKTSIQKLDSQTTEIRETLPSGATVINLLPKIKPSRILVSLHGGPESFEGTEIRYLGLYRELLRNGWGISILNYRGSSNQTDDVKKSAWKNWRRSIIQDFNELQNYFKRKLDLKHIDYNLLGGSFGGALALILTKEFRIHRTVLLSPLLDLKSQVDRAGLEYKKWFATRFSKEDLHDFSFENLLTDTHQSVLIVVSTRDRVLCPNINRKAVNQVRHQNSNWKVLEQRCGHVPKSYNASFKRYNETLGYLLNAPQTLT